MTRGAPTLAAPEIVLVRYGELALKGGNRRSFEKALMRNIRDAVRPLTPVAVERTHGRIQVIPERRSPAVARRVADVFGVKTASPAWGVANDVDAIVEVARALLHDALEEHAGDFPVSFRIRVKRANKGFPLRSAELERHVADRILPGPDRVEVRLDDPELSLGIEVRETRSYLFLRSLPGPGGLPVGTLGRALCLLSGGIDSPVAAWLAMKRGCHVGHLSFHSAPYLGEGFKKKVADLVRVLTRWQPRATLYVAPFAEVQTTIRDVAPEAYRTVLYRRMMQRIGARLCEREGFQALVTGECLGQVASQTLENMRCIAAATERMVLQPLLTFDKEEIITLARRIGTFEVSSHPQPDCCTVFQPAHPVIRGRLEECAAAEHRMDVEGLVERAVEGTETRVLEYEG